MRYLTFALAKGRLAKKSMELFGQIGITCKEMEDPATRKLIFVNEELDCMVRIIHQPKGRDASLLKPKIFLQTVFRSET